MKTRTRLLLGAVLLGLALVGRSWLMIAAVPEPDDEPIQPRLSAQFDTVLELIEVIRPLHEVKRPNQPGDWLERFPESGQTFRQYVQLRDNHPLIAESSGIDIQPLGEFDETQLRIVERTAEFMGHFFGVPVHQLPAESLREIPEASRRMRQGTEQVLSTWLMSDVLKPRRRPEAMATIGLVTCDLWPGDLNWVFGQASISDRVGVWSLHRNGDPGESDAAFRLCLRRTLKTAVHETGHMLGIPHCAAYECCLNGSRSREESDRQPLEFCPECQAKIWWTCGAEPAARCRSLLAFCRGEGLDPEAEFFRREYEAINSRPRPVQAEATPAMP